MLMAELIIAGVAVVTLVLTVLIQRDGQAKMRGEMGQRYCSRR